MLLAKLLGDPLARLLGLDLRRPTSRAQETPAFRFSSSSPAKLASSPALSFSQTRGTENHQVGRTSGR